MTGSLAVAAPAKVNLFLHVGLKRADGYHDIQSLVAFAELCDEITLDLDHEFSLSLSGPFATQLSDNKDNLALRAARLLAERTGTMRGVRIGLRKNLPVASGLGGGSADAAAVLRALMPLWQLRPDQRVLLNAAEELGADVPVCITSETAWMEGKGERIRRLSPLPQAGVLLVNPGVQISTAHVFGVIGPRHGTGMSPLEERFPDVFALVHFLRDTSNDLEPAAQQMAPAIVDVLKDMSDLPGVLLARMSGSGATCFALFADEESASVAARLLRRRRPDWWIRETAFRDR